MDGSAYGKIMAGGMIAMLVIGVMAGMVLVGLGWGVWVALSHLSIAWHP